MIKKRFFYQSVSSFGLVFLLITGCGKGITRRPYQEARFHTLSEEILESFFHFYPVTATEKGVHRYDHLLANFTPLFIANQIKKLQSFQQQLREINPRHLGFDDQIDYELLSSNVDVLLMNLDALKEWERNPVLYVDESIFGIYYLLLRDFAPMEERLVNIEKRLFQMPRLFKEAKENVKNPPRVFVEVAIEELEAGVDFIEESISELARQHPKEAPMLTTAKALAVEAMKNYRDHLISIKDDVDGELAIGRDLYEFKLKREHFLDLTPEELLAIGERVLQETQTQLDSIGFLRSLESTESEESGHSTPSTLRPLTPPPEGFSKEDVLDYYQGEIQSVRMFCEEKGLVTIPRDIGDCRVVETPKFLQGLLPGIAYMPPPPFDSLQTGYFYVRSIPEEFTEEDRQHYYSMVKNREFRGGVVHEAYPGHHLQLSLSNRFPSKVRVYQQSNLFAEGWALYCEELMVDEGLYEEKWDAVEELARWIRFRAARVILDVKLQSGEFDYDSAVNFLVEEFGEEDRDYFEKEVKRYCLSPTQPMSYLVGKLQISDLRKKVEKLMGEDFSLQRFHDLLLSEGTIPLKLVERKILHRLKGQ